MAPLFAAGLVFLNRDPAKAAARAPRSHRAIAAREAAGRGLSRVCPSTRQACGSEALKTLPIIEQVFVNAGGDIDEATFNRKLYLGAPALRETPRRQRPGLLHPVAVGQHHRLQGHGDAAVSGAVLSGPQGSADGGLGGGVPPALFHQYPAAVAARASRIATWRTTARSTRCRATAAGRWRAARCSARRCCRILSDILPRGVVDGLGFAVARQHARSCCWSAVSIPCMPCACWCRRRGSRST